jgi:predicted nucleic acid-binding protein
VEFEPVLHWVTNGSGFVVYGGSKYKDELRNSERYLGIFNELKNKRKLKEVNHALVNEHQKIVEDLAKPKSFNDAHIIAIFRVSGCRLLCSNDKRSFSFIQDKRFYLKRQKIPSIYTNRSHKNLLHNGNVVSIRNEV